LGDRFREAYHGFDWKEEHPRSNLLSERQGQTDPVE
jgi:hypothetical protein